MKNRIVIVLEGGLVEYVYAEGDLHAQIEVLDRGLYRDHFPTVSDMERAHKLENAIKKMKQIY